MKTYEASSPEWQKAADDLLVALARENKYVVADMLSIFLESAGYGLDNYSALGPVFRRAARKGIIKRIEHRTKQALWHSLTYGEQAEPQLREGQTIGMQGFGESVDGNWLIAGIYKAYEGSLDMRLERVA